MLRSPFFRSATLVFLMALPASAATPALVVLPDGANLIDTVHALEASGVRVRQRVPPRLIVADFPNAPALAGAQIYTGAVPVSLLQPLGPVAVAAGVSWNRGLLSNAAATGLSVSAMRSSVASGSLTAPLGLTVSATADRLRCAWMAVPGATFYTVEASRDASFTSVDVMSAAGLTSVDLPLPPAAGTVYVRVRASDHGHAGPDDDVDGDWSQSVSAAVAAVPSGSGSAPIPTSPADGIETSGFTVNLEWTGAAPARVQVSRAADFSSVLFDQIVDVAQFSCAQQAMDTGDRLYWRVRAESPFRSDWSPTRQILIGSAHREAADAFVNPEAPK